MPVGLGSHVHWDRKLDALLAQAIMSIQAVKGVEIGDGFEVAGRRGSVAHDPISWDADASDYRRGSTLAGGTEGGISTGELLVVRAAMKPLATLNTPTLETVDIATKESTVSFKERTDVTAVPAMGVVAETMVALVLAARGAAQVRWRLGRRVRPQRRGVHGIAVVNASRHLVLVGMMGVGKSTVGRAVAVRARPPAVRLRRDDRGAHRSYRPGHLVTDGEPAFRALETEVLVDALAESEPCVIAAAGGVVLSEANRDALRRPGGARRVAALRGRRCSLDRVRSGGHRPLLDDDPEATLRRLYDERAPLYQEVADAHRVGRQPLRQRRRQGGAAMLRP